MKKEMLENFKELPEGGQFALTLGVAIMSLFTLIFTLVQLEWLIKYYFCGCVTPL